MTNFAALDLNLLRVFDAMMAEGSTVRAGERIGLSQPAVSSALGRLRHITGDELFVRDGNRMMPTPKALALKEPVRSALRQLEDALSLTVGFDPAASERSFLITGSDYFSTLLMPKLAASATPEAPNITLQMLDHPAADAFRLLSEGKADLAVDRQMETPDWIRSSTLFRSHILCLARRGHPVLSKHAIRPGERIPPEVFCEIPHVMLSMDGGKVGTIDPQLQKHGLQRRVAMTVPHFHAVALAAAASDLLGNLPVHFARYVADLLDIELYLPPFDPAAIDVKLYWHRRLDRDPANMWLRRYVETLMDFDGCRTRHGNTRVKAM